MQTEHIIGLLDENGAEGLSQADRAAIERHAAQCESCGIALRAHFVASSLVAARANESFEVSPFFTTRVMAAIRERRESGEELGIAGLWRAAWSLVTAMAIIVVVLTGATILRSEDDYPDPELRTARTIYSPAWDALATSTPGTDLSDEQIVGVLYESEVANEQ